MTTALLITFTSKASPGELAKIAAGFVDALASVDGLISKTWLEIDGGSGGFYLFRDEKSADAYLAGDLVAQLGANPLFSDFHVQRFGVDEPLSVRSRGLPAPQ